LKHQAHGSLFAYSLYFSAGALAREAEKLAIACWKPVGLSASQAQIIQKMARVATVRQTTRNPAKIADIC
jgi:hypothetical protein